MHKLLFALLIIYLVGCQTTTSPDKERSKTLNTPEGMVIIPTGTFPMGGKSSQASYDEYPVHEVSVSAFYMDVTEVTNSQFKAFVDATNYITVAERDIDWSDLKEQLPPGTPEPPAEMLKAGSLVFQPTDGPVDLNNYAQWWIWTTGANWKEPGGPGSTIEGKMNHPVVHIAWEDALAYAEWAGKRLPTEAEWEWAALGGNSNNKYPWGNESVENSYDKANFWQGVFPFKNNELDGFFGTAPVKSFPANGYGLYDMAGNVWEWCQDKYDASIYQKYSDSGVMTNPLGSEMYNDPREPQSPKHVIRGGSFLCNDSYCSGYRVARRMSSSKDSGFNHTGFRCVKSIDD